MHQIPIAAVQSAITGIKLAVLLLEMREKNSYLQFPYREYPPEATSGIINLSFVWWINQLFVMGYRKLIGKQDLFELDPRLASGPAGEQLKRVWEKHGLFIFTAGCTRRMCEMLTRSRERKEQALAALGLCTLFLEGVSCCSVASVVLDWVQLRPAFSNYGGGPAYRATGNYGDPEWWLWSYWSHFPGLSGYCGRAPFCAICTVRL